jgi:hypothetical protein
MDDGFEVFHDQHGHVVTTEGLRISAQMFRDAASQADAARGAYERLAEGSTCGECGAELTEAGRSRPDGISSGHEEWRSLYPGTVLRSGEQL